VQRSTFAFLTLAIGVTELASADPSSGANANGEPRVIGTPAREPHSAATDAGAGGQGAEGGEAGEAGAGGAAGETGGAGWSAAARGAVRREPTELDAQGSDFGGGAELALVSRFIWRGLALGHGSALQPGAWASYAGFTASIWANLPLTHDASRYGVSAFEPELAFDATWGPLRLEPRLTLFWMHDLAFATVTTEAGLEAMLAVYGPVSLVNSHHVDVMETPGAYYGTLGPRVEQHLGPLHFTAAVDVGYASAPYNRAYFGVRDAALDLLEASLAARFNLEHSLYAEANAGLSTLLPDALRATSSEPTLAYVGVAFGFDR
jgi:hypothetical protein